MTPSSLLRARTGAAIAGVAIALSAATVVAHSATRATERAPSSNVPADVPADAPSPTPSGSAVGPDATGPAAFGLCKAWANHAKHDDGKERAAGSVAMRNLAEAAGGKAKVEAYCATVPHPSQRAKGDKPDKPDKAEKADREDKPDKGEKAGPKDKVEKQPGKAGRSGKDKPVEPSPSASPSPSSS